MVVLAHIIGIEGLAVGGHELLQVGIFEIELNDLPLNELGFAPFQYLILLFGLTGIELLEQGDRLPFLLDASLLLEKLVLLYKDEDLLDLEVVFEGEDPNDLIKQFQFFLGLVDLLTDLVGIFDGNRLLLFKALLGRLGLIYHRVRLLGRSLNRLLGRQSSHLDIVGRK